MSPPNTMSSKVGAIEPKSGGQRSSRCHSGTVGVVNGGEITQNHITNQGSNNNQRQIQTLLRNEGRSARNLVSWSVPFDEEKEEQLQLQHQHNIKSNSNDVSNDDMNEFTTYNGRHGNKYSKSPRKWTNRGGGGTGANDKHQMVTSLPVGGAGIGRRRGGDEGSGNNRHNRHHKSNRFHQNNNHAPVNNSSNNTSRHHQRQRRGEGSGGTRSGSREGDEKTRFWNFLMDNLDRAVDAIYSVCDQNESVQQATEMKLLLANYVKDFDNLIDKIKIQDEFDKAEEKPLSISWEVRKSSSPMKAPNAPAIVDSNGTMRHLVFASWADRVRGSPLLTVSTLQNQPGQEVMTAESDAIKECSSENGIGPQNEATEQDDYEEGWEKISKVRPNKGSSKDSRNKKHAVSALSKTAPVSNKATNSQLATCEKENLPITSPTADCSSAAVIGNDDIVARDNRREVADNQTCEESLSAMSRNDWVDLKEEKQEVVMEVNCGSKALADSYNITEINGIKEHDLKQVQGQTSPGSLEQQQPNDLNGYVTLTPRSDDDLGEDVNDLEENNDLETELNECFDIALEECDEEESQLVHELEDISLQDMPPPVGDDDDEDDFEEMAASGDGATLDQNQTSGLSSMNHQNESSLYDGRAKDASAQSKDCSQLSWADLVEEEEETRRMCNRDTSRALVIHERLSSPSRTTSWSEKKLRHEEKQRKAQELRSKALEETMVKQRNLALRIQEVRRWKNEILEQKKRAYQQKLTEAEDKRKAHLQKIVKKAHEEENKVNEIAFIMTLEAQNKRAEMKSKHEIYEARKQELEEGRLRKREEARALEEAVKERRNKMESEKEARLSELQTRREGHMKRIASLQEARETERIEATRKREEEREKKLAMVVERERDAVEGLVKRLQEKQDESEARYKQLIVERQQRAAELAHGPHLLLMSPGDLMGAAQNGAGDSHHPHSVYSILAKTGAPSIEPFLQPKMCFLCNMQLKNEISLISHVRGRKHLEMMRKELNRNDPVSELESERFSAKYVGDLKPTTCEDPVPTSKVEQERLNNLKKKLKKVRTRMNQKGKEFDLQNDGCLLSNSTSSNKNSANASVVGSENKSKLQKLLKEINKQIANSGSGVWPHNKVAALDRSLGELDRMLAGSDAGGGGVALTNNSKQNESRLTEAASADRQLFREQSGFAIVCRVLLLANEVSDKVPSVIPNKSQSLAASVLLNSCVASVDNCRYLLYTNKISPFIDILNDHISMLLKDLPRCGPSTVQPLPQSTLVLNISKLISLILDSVVTDALKNDIVGHTNIKQNNSSSGKCTQITISRPVVNDNCKIRIIDVISYLVCCGLFDRMSELFHGIRKSVYSDLEGALLLTSLMNLATSATKALQIMLGQVVCEALNDDHTYLVGTLGSTELLGSVSLLYGTLLHSDILQQRSNSIDIGAASKPLLPPTSTTTNSSSFDINANNIGAASSHNNLPPLHVLEFVTSTLSFINAAALLDTPAIQLVLSDESLSLQLRHIASSLFNSCSVAVTDPLSSCSALAGLTSAFPSFGTSSVVSTSIPRVNDLKEMMTSSQSSASSAAIDLLHEVILTIGYFALLNQDNQLIVQAGSPPTLLQQLCVTLPFHYFSGDDNKMEVLLPTLIACCHSCVANKLILQTEITPKLLANYLNDQLEKFRTNSSNHNSLNLVSGSKFSLIKRFPLNQWRQAVDFFNSSCDSSSNAT